MNMQSDFVVRQQEMGFYTGRSVIMDWIYFSFCLRKVLTDGLEWCELLGAVVALMDRALEL